MKADHKNKIIALGTGTSTGIPMIGCSCAVCTSLDHRDQRLRTSIYVETDSGKKFLVDTTPDLRTQFLRSKISDVDFVIVTHAHADHLHGIDDLRPLTFNPSKNEIPIYTDKATTGIMQRRFDYIFKKPDHKSPILGGGLPRLTVHSVPLEKKITIQGEAFYFFQYPHGHGTTMGFIHRSKTSTLAYIVDCMEIPEAILKTLEEMKISLLIIDCLKRGVHSTHLTVDRTFGYIKRIKPERAGLIHMSHDLFHSELERLACAEFGKNIFPLYDELIISY
jgi:phosphoribosyl 1,2-cyclic phosphate phosphodiesterase